MKHKIFIMVPGGVAEVCEETVPAGIGVEILDFDNFASCAPEYLWKRFATGERSARMPRLFTFGAATPTTRG
jgi:hypothetical protein